MGLKIIGVAALVIYGAMLADVLSHGQTAVALVNSFSGMWTQSVKSVAGQQ